MKNGQNGYCGRALCMGMAGCEWKKNTSNADAEQKSETASETREKDRHRSRRIQKEVKAELQTGIESYRRQDLLSQILQR